MKLTRRESDIVRACMQYLKARGYYTIRMNTGCIQTTKGSYFRQGTKGMADILCLKYIGKGFGDLTAIDKPIYAFQVIWVEVKAEKGVQSPFQKAFQQDVEARGYRYILVRSIDDLQEAGL